jgi:SAM-dependent methyltransferase
MKAHTRSFEKIHKHYSVERELADRLRKASPEDRRLMYGSLYDELYQRIDDHPLLLRKIAGQDEADARKIIATQSKFLRRFTTSQTVFLEVGAGSCLLSLAIAKVVKQVYALDVSAEMTRRASYPSNFALTLFDGCRVPPECLNVTLAYSHQVMEHVHPDDAVEQLKSIYKCLLPGGSYVCIVPNRLNGPHDISKYFDEVATGFHMKEYTTTELAQLFRSVGFSEVSSYVGAKGRYVRLPQIALIAMEYCFSKLPYKARSWAGRRVPLRPLLEIRMVGRK